MRQTAAWLLLLLAAAPAVPRVALADGWFVPPPTAHGGAAVDVTLGNSVENITVIANRPSRSWRSVVQLPHLNDPRASDAMAPQHTFKTEPSYCNSALRTVGGQPAGAVDMVAGMAAGRC